MALIHLHKEPQTRVEDTTARLLTVHKGLKKNGSGDNREIALWEIKIVNMLTYLCTYVRVDGSESEGEVTSKQGIQRRAQVILRIIHQLGDWRQSSRHHMLIQCATWLKMYARLPSSSLEVVEQYVLPNVKSPGYRIQGLAIAIGCLRSMFNDMGDTAYMDLILRYSEEVLDLVPRVLPKDAETIQLYRILKSIVSIYLSRLGFYQLEASFLWVTIKLSPPTDPETNWLPIFFAESFLWSRRYSHAEELFRQVLKNGCIETTAVATVRLALIAWERDNKAETLKLATKALEVLPKQYRQEIGICKVLLDMCNGVYHDNLGSWIESISILIDLLPSTVSDTCDEIMGSILAQSAMENAVQNEGTEDTDRSQVNWLHIASGFELPLKLQGESSDHGHVSHVIKFPDMSTVCTWSYKFYTTRREALIRLEALMLKKGDEVKDSDKSKEANEMIGYMKSIFTEMDANITDLLRSLRHRKKKKTKKRDTETCDETCVDDSAPEEESDAKDTMLEEDMENLSLGDDDCSVCFRDLTDGGVVELTCHHRFHDHCVDDWIVTCRHKRLPPTCPICRGDLMI